MLHTLIQRALPAIADDARRCYPNESCGLLLDGGDYLPCPNAAPDPRTAFVIPWDMYLTHDGRIAGVVHSHPDGPEHPSRRDMEGQLATALPWILVATDGTAVSPPIVWGDGDVPPLIGRTFRHGVTDCYSLIRGWFQVERGVALPEFPRDEAWWEKGGDLYRQGFRAAGFRVVDAESAAAGDVVLMQIRSPVPNHAGVLLDNGLLLHHLTGRLSRREPAGPWRRMVTHYLRHQGDLRHQGAAPC